MDSTEYTRNPQHAQTYGPLATFQERGLLPPAGVYVTQDDTIQLRSWAPTGNQTVRVTLRMLNNSGVVSTCFKEIAVAANGATAQVDTIQGDEGFLLSASVDSDAIQRGLCYVQLIIRRGTGASDLQLGQVLMQGYVYITGMLAYPQSPNVQSVDGRGALRIITVATPAAGAEWTQTVPAGREWIVRAITWTFVASAVVASRLLFVIYNDGGATNIRLPAGLVQTASQNVSYSFVPGSGTSLGAGLPIAIPAPAHLRMGAGWNIGSLTAGIDAGDQYSNIALHVDEFISQ